MSLLEGRTALVTGAANGIGLAIAERLAAEGAPVVAVDVEDVPDLGPSVRGLRWDLSETESLDGLLVEAEAAVGPLDVLVNNAGIFEPALAVDLTLESLRARARRQSATRPSSSRAGPRAGWSSGATGASSTSRPFTPASARRPRSAYDIAKGGLEQATRTLAVELSRHGVLVNAVAPGFVATRMSVVDGKDELESEGFTRRLRQAREDPDPPLRDAGRDRRARRLARAATATPT